MIRQQMTHGDEAVNIAEFMALTAALAIAIVYGLGLGSYVQTPSFWSAIADTLYFT